MTSSPDPAAWDALTLAYDRLQQRYQALAAFMGLASHELRAPINQVMSLHQLILADLCEDPAEERLFITQANQAITRMLHNLDTLIRLSKLDLGSMTPTWTPVALGAVLKLVQRLMEMPCVNRQCRLTVSPGAADLVVLSDERWLLQALLSLVEAALAAGSTTIHLGLAEGDDRTVTLRLTCNALPKSWPPPPPTQAPPTPDTPTLSPAFHYHLAQRLLGHLRSALTPDPAPPPDPVILTMTLPRANLAAGE